MKTILLQTRYLASRISQLETFLSRSRHECLRSKSLKAFYSILIPKGKTYASGSCVSFPFVVGIVFLELTAMSPLMTFLPFKPKRQFHRQKCGSFESAISMSCGRLTMEANGKITKKVYGD